MEEEALVDADLVEARGVRVRVLLLLPSLVCVWPPLHTEFDV